MFDYGDIDHWASIPITFLLGTQLDPIIEECEDVVVDPVLFPEVQVQAVPIDLSLGVQDQMLGYNDYKGVLGFTTAIR